MVDLGLSRAEVLELTPAELQAALRMHRRRRREDHLMLAQVVAAVMNNGMRSLEKPANPEDFVFPEFKAEPVAQRAPRRMNGKRRAEIADSFRRLFREDANPGQ